MRVAELGPGLWRWTAPHPAWSTAQGGPNGWEQEVASYYHESGGDMLLIDPIVPAAGRERQRFWRAVDRDVEKLGAPNVVLTCAWHARSSGDVLERYPTGRLWVPAGGAADLPPGLRATDPFRPGDDLPGGVAAIRAVAGGDAEVLLWLPSRAALAAGDILLGGGRAGIRVCPRSWLGGADPEAVRAELRTRLDGLPVELVLVTHGEPVLVNGRDALDRALA